MERGNRRVVVLVVALVAAGLASPAVPAEATPLPAPTITGVSPSTGPTAGGDVVTVTGTNLAATQSLSFGSGSAANLAAQQPVTTSLTDAKTIYEANSQSYPATAPMAAQLMANEPSIDFSTGTVGFNGVIPQVSAATSTDGNSVVLAAVSQSGTCFYVADNTQNEPLPSPPGLPSVPPGAGEWFGSLPATSCTAASDPVVDWVTASWAGQGGVPATGVTCTDTRCTATVPAGSFGTVDVSVITDGGPADLPDAYTYAVLAPDAPSSVQLTGGPDEVTAGWTVPADNGSPITDFSLRLDEGSTPIVVALVPSGTAGSPLDPTPGAHDSFTFTAVVDGTPVTASVAAVNALGTGPATVSNAATPVGLPGAPVVDGVEPLDHGTAVHWSPPASDGGSPVTGYTVTPYLGSMPLAATTVPAGPGVAPDATVTGLTDGVAYTFAVTASNTAGTGPASARSTPVVPGAGYRLAAADGGVFSLGTAGFLGSATATSAAPVVGVTSTPDQGGYWLVAADGGVFSYGDAAFLGSMGGVPLTRPVVGMAAAPDGRGYWLAAADGGVFAFGDAAYFGSMGSRVLNAPIVAVVPTPDGDGYWLVAADGGVFAFGDAGFPGSMGGTPLRAPIVGAAGTPDGRGYWLVAADGGVFAFGDADFHGSAGGSPSASPVVGIAPTAEGGGYWLAQQDGGVLTYGDAPVETPLGTLAWPVVGIAAY